MTVLCVSLLLLVCLRAFSLYALCRCRTGSSTAALYSAVYVHHHACLHARYAVFSASLSLELHTSQVHANCAHLQLSHLVAGVIMRKERAGLAAPLGVKILDQSLLVSFGGS